MKHLTLYILLLVTHYVTAQDIFLLKDMKSLKKSVVIWIKTASLSWS